MKAITVKQISGSCIPTIEIGTEFEIDTVVEDRGYATCKGLPVTAVWEHEYKILKGTNSRAENSEDEG